ncbi:TPM-like protein [Mya arenaria]|uniref:TPM-like protein n=1 Tax=Mya arenaria TaxID=6604 RepID=A0ABY7DS33_MYAAR|nr:TPM-like protein [Mya arenaria]
MLCIATRKCNNFNIQMASQIFKSFKGYERYYRIGIKLNMINVIISDIYNKCSVLEKHIWGRERRMEDAERENVRLRGEVEHLENELLAEKEKYKQISDELDQTFAELAGM